MPTQRGNGIYYVKRRFKGIDPPLVYRSLGTRSKTRARTLEDMLVSLHGQGRLDIVRAFQTGRIAVATIAEFYEMGRLPELAQRLAAPDPVTLAVACLRALKDKQHEVRPRTLDGYRHGLAHLQRIVGESKPIQAVLTEEVLREFRSTRIEEGVALETCNNDMVAVSVLASYALRQGWITSRPRIKPFKTASRERWLEAGDLGAYMATLRSPFRTQMQLLVATGMRLGETEALRVCDLSFSAAGECRASIRDAKTTAGVRNVFVPNWASSTLVKHIRTRGLDGASQLFAIPRRSVQSEHKRACRLAGIHDYRIHDHRHTAAVALARAGMPLHLLQGQLGHKNIAMTMRYAKFHPDYADVASYFERVSETLGLAAPGNVSGHTEATMAEATVAP